MESTQHFYVYSRCGDTVLPLLGGIWQQDKSRWKFHRKNYDKVIEYIESLTEPETCDSDVESITGESDGNMCESDQDLSDVEDTENKYSGLHRASSFNSINSDC